MRALLLATALLGFLVVACSPAPAPVIAPTARSASPSASSAPPEAGSPPKVARCDPDDAYLPTPARSGRAPDLPNVPLLPQRPTKVGDAFTVFGATHALRSRFGSTEVMRGEITVVGYIVDENMKSAPSCAIHKTGKADPEGCSAQMPAFVIADARDAATGIKVLGWARNFAIIFDATAAYANGKPAQPVRDDIFAIDLPFPLPAAGAKVKVTGTYGFSFTKSSNGLVADPQNGILTYARMEALEPAPRPAHLGK